MAIKAPHGADVALAEYDKLHDRRALLEVSQVPNTTQAVFQAGTFTRQLIFILLPYGCALYLQDELYHLGILHQHQCSQSWWRWLWPPAPSDREMTVMAQLEVRDPVKGIVLVSWFGLEQLIVYHACLTRDRPLTLKWRLITVPTDRRCIPKESPPTDWI